MEIMEDIMNNKKSYASLPNFTRADCLRTVISSTNKASGNCHRGMEGNVGQLDHKNDIKICILPEKYTIDKITDSGPQLSGSLDYNVVHSLYNKGFIYFNKREVINVDPLHSSCWNVPSVNTLKSTLDPRKILLSQDGEESRSPEQEALQDPADTAKISNLGLSTGHTKHIAFLFDSIIAFLMMGNLSPKVGKLSPKSLDSFPTELKKVQNTDEEKSEQPNYGFLVTLLHCESLLDLDAATYTRVLNKNYTLLVSLAPLTNEFSPSAIVLLRILDQLSRSHCLEIRFPFLLLSKGTRLQKPSHTSGLLLSISNVLKS
ncbi:hypothetical protein HPG69_012104 [Diceros bicornis minor]|uniref:Uncharacterized protein n=1 Tax=Diceros bicornis minor TaxID=77932 RepID=A0A7J7EHR8_DICBM|nr:hypothetical protein HPG69_012104 [Diceros bicornis minor]